MNFIEEFKKGQDGGNKGLPMGAGLYNLSKAINGVQRARMYGVAAAPKAGKSTFVNYAFLLQPYLYALENGIDIEWIYFSFELDRVSIEFDLSAYFLYYDHDIVEIGLPKGVLKDGKSVVSLSPDYLRGRMQDDNEKIIKVNDFVFEKLKEVYETRIIPLFGEYSMTGKPISKGCITFVEEKDNPTGLRNYLLAHASKQGNFVYEKFGKTERIIGYRANNPKKYTIIITDHLRKLVPERGFQMKQTVDKYIEYTVELRNWCQYTFVHIIHLNRSLSSVNRMQEFGDLLFPSSDDIKDTGETKHNYVFTCFIPSNTVDLMKIKI